MVERGFVPHLGVVGEDEKRNLVAEGVMKDSSDGTFVGGHGTEADWGEARHWSQKHGGKIPSPDPVAYQKSGGGTVRLESNDAMFQHRYRVV